MAEVVLYAVAARPGEHDREEASFWLAPIKYSHEVEYYRDQISQNWIIFLDDLERRLTAVTQARPSVTTADVIAVRDAIYAVVEETIGRVGKRVESDPLLADRVRQEAATTFQFPAALKPAFRSQFYDELKQILRFGVFVFAQKLVLYRVLEEAGPRRRSPFRLAPFIYVTAVPNGVGEFDKEAYNNYAQNFAASHNAGIALNYLMAHFLSAIATR